MSVYDKIIPELNRLLEDGGTLYLPAGEQTGIVAFHFDCQGDCVNLEDEGNLPFETKLYPIRAFQCVKNYIQVNMKLIEKQKKHLESLFSAENIQIAASPIRSDKNGSYFVITK